MSTAVSMAVPGDYKIIVPLLRSIKKGQKIIYFRGAFLPQKRPESLQCILSEIEALKSKGIITTAVALHLENGKPVEDTGMRLFDYIAVGI